MNDLIVISAITHRAGMIDEYEDQLDAAGIDHHFHPIKLENGIVSITARWKFEFLREMCREFNNYERIVFTDGWDVLFYGGKEEALRKIPEQPIMSAEHNCWPESNLADKFTSPSPWRYCNPGMIAGSPAGINLWLQFCDKLGDTDLMEQKWCNRIKANPVTNYLIKLDVETKLFYVVSHDSEDGFLRLNEGRPWNSRFNNSPQFFHFSGHCSSVPFRGMLRGVTKSLNAYLPDNAALPIPPR